jgi:hypothetical protein
VLASHLKGEAHIGLYPLLDGDKCWWLDADFDGPEAMFDALMYVKAGRALQVPVALEVSRSAVGAHAWEFFTAPVPAELARRLGSGLLRVAMALEGRTAHIHADLRDPAAILSHPDTRALLDFGQPIALMLVAILHFAPDEFKPAESIATLLDALPPGSYLVASHPTTEHPVATSAGQQTMREAGMAMQKRDSDVFAGLAFSGLELVPPGVVLVSEWRPAETGPRPLPSEVNCYAGVARKP